MADNNQRRASRRQRGRAPSPLPGEPAAAPPLNGDLAGGRAPDGLYGEADDDDGERGDAGVRALSPPNANPRGLGEVSDDDDDPRLAELQLEAAALGVLWDLLLDALPEPVGEVVAETHAAFDWDFDPLCACCYEPLGDEDHGVVVDLGCSAGEDPHRFHAKCLADAWRAVGSQRCPLCRTTATAPAVLSLVEGGAAAVHEVKQYAVLLAPELQLRQQWDALPPAVRNTDVHRTALQLHGPVRPPVAGQWEAVDAFTPFDCVVTPCCHVSDVPDALRPLWATANVDVLEYVAAAQRRGDALALERGLKWQLLLPDVLLRGPKRGTRGAARGCTHELETRFEAWRTGERWQLVRWLQESRAKARASRAARAAKRQSRRAQRRELLDEVHELVCDGELSRAVSLLRSNGVADLTPGVVAQLQRKHPARQQKVPAQLPPAHAAPRVGVSLLETLRALRRRTGTFGGLRNEFLRALVGTYGDVRADSVLPRYDDFATCYASGELPAWYYAATAVAGLVPLVKKPLTPAERQAGVEPDARPVAVGGGFFRAVGTAVTDATKASFLSVLSPQQLAVGVSGGCEILVHGVRLLLELNPHFVVVKIDLRNGYGEVSRAAILRRFALQPLLAHLVPLLHAVLAAPTDLVLDGGAAGRLFADGLRAVLGDAVDGVFQGWGPAAAAFSVAIHPELKALDRELSCFGGMARAQMDDVVAAGPREAVFTAVARFLTRLEAATNLVGQLTKFQCFSPSLGAALYNDPWRRRTGVPVGARLRPDGQPNFGLVVAEVPIGDPLFVNAVFEEKADVVVSFVRDTVKELRSVSPFDAWSVLHTACQQKLDYHLRLALPDDVVEAAERVDDALAAAACELGVDLDDSFVSDRFFSPARHRGGGFRRREWLRRVAFCASLVETAERFYGAAPVPQLHSLFGPAGTLPFAAGGTRFTHFLARGTASADALADSWGFLWASVSGAGVRGPLDVTVDRAGEVRGDSDRLQRALTTQVEQVRRDALHARFAALPPADPRRQAWFACDPSTSAAWVTGHATSFFDYTKDEFNEVVATYFGQESPALRHCVGRYVPCSNTAGRGRVCDAYGVQLGLATLPGGAHTACHDAAAHLLWDVLREAGVTVDDEPRSVFANVLPLAVLNGTAASGRRPGVVPDGLAAVPLPPLRPRAQHDRWKPPPALPQRVLLFDVKTVYQGGPCYCSARGRDTQCGGVDERAWQVHLEYRRAADGLDRAADAARDQRLAAQGQPAGPATHAVRVHLDTFTPVRGLVFGQYGEVSSDVRELLRFCAGRLGVRRWRSYGFPTAGAAVGFFLTQLNRRVGLHVTREFARHRLRRLHYVGVDKDTLARRGALPNPGDALPEAGAGLRYQDAAAFLGALQRRGDAGPP